MTSFSIPYNNDVFLLDRLFEEFPNSKKLCKEIFFAIPNKFAGTGRALSQSADYEQEITKLTQKACECEVESNILVNSGCLGLCMSDTNFINQLINYLNNLRETFGLNMVTVSDYVLAKEIKKALPDIKLECSSIAYIDSLEKAKYWEDLGCDIIVIPPTLNKNLNFIKQLDANLPDVKLKMVLNQVCLHSCPMWHSHHNIRGHCNDGELYTNTCKDFFNAKPWALYSSSYVPPKYMSYYDQYIDIYKLVDRKFTTNEILQVFGAYSQDERYQEIFNECNKKIPEEIFEKVILCDKNCSKCSLCEYTYKNMNVDG